jgi:hypothetical protein
MENDFELVGQITGIEVIAVNLSIRELQGLKAQFGGRRWRKLKGLPSFGSLTEKSIKQNCIGMKHMALGGVK